VGSVLRMGFADAAGPVLASGTASGGGATVTAPGAAVADANSLVLVVMGVTRPFTNASEPAGMDIELTVDNSSGTGGARMRIASQAFAAAGTFDAVSADFTLAGTDDPVDGRRWIAHTIVVRRD